MGNVRATFLKPLESVFTLPATKDVKGFIEAYENSLKTFTDHTLSMAAQRIIDTRETRTFPLPAECSKACRDTIAAMKAERETGQKTGNRFEIANAPLEVRDPTCNPNRRKRTDEMFAEFHYSGDAIEAYWGWTLWDWMNEHQRVPDPHELRQLEVEAKMKARRFRNMVGINSPDDIEKVGNAPLRKLLLFWEKANERLANLVRDKENKNAV